jgi:asparagine synthase (glutamine-hydrolysing)
MLQTLAHRGRDGMHTWQEGGTGFGHAMLYTTPESLHETLPLSNAAGTITLTADARIDNREELLRALRLRSTPELLSDSALILAAYERWGEDCVDRLLGDFAFAVWDAREQKLFCARDPLGMKPFYYTRQDGRLFAFASEIKAIQCLPDVSRQLNESRLANYLAARYEDAEETFFQGVLRLPAGHVLVVKPGSVTRRTYYTVSPAENVSFKTDAEYSERFAELFTEAVRCRLRSAFPVAGQLSGGLDSSYVACVARDLFHRENRGSFKTLSLVFNESARSDEREYINAVLAQGGFEPTFIDGDRKGFLTDLDRVNGFSDDGPVSGNYHLVWQLLEAAGSQDVRILLDGVDGDSVVDHGYLYLSELFENGQWSDFAREVKLLTHSLKEERHIQPGMTSHTSPKKTLNAYALPHLLRWATTGAYGKFFQGAHHLSRDFGIPFPRLVRPYWKRLITPAWVLQPHDARREAGKARIPAYINPDFADRINLVDRIAEARQRGSSEKGVRERQLNFLQTGKTQLVFEFYDHAAAAVGVESRHPFMDKRLIEYCLALPSSQSFQQGWPRWILRQAMAGTVPDSVRWRAGKGNMQHTLMRGVMERDSKTAESLRQDLTQASDFINVQEATRLFHSMDKLTSHGWAMLMQILSLAHWLKENRFRSDTGLSSKPTTKTLPVVERLPQAEGVI